MLKPLLISILIITILSALLFKSVQANGEYRENLRHKDAEIKTISEEIHKLEETRKQEHEVAKRNIERRNKIIQSLRTEMSKLRSLEDAEPEVKEFVSIPIPSSVVGWLRAENDSDAKDGETVPSSSLPAGDASASPSG